jgi:2-keto-4-pentenoate hydratase/2-oxohepta-3-ene-1,7-dioic acid hydratase in catechol pathway
MRIVSYRRDENDAWRCAVKVGDLLADAAEAAAKAGLGHDQAEALASTRTLVALDPAVRGRIGEAAAGVASIESDSVELGPPVWDPEKIVCLGLNYRDHAEEAGLTPPDAPMFFAKYANSLSGPTAAIVPPTSTEQVDYEAELAIVIGRGGRDIPREAALDHVFGAMAFNDVSARDLQLANPLWTGGKAIDTFGPCGPSLVTLDEIENLQGLAVSTRVNGETVQDGNSASMIFNVADTIAFLSQIMTLTPGDVIATGTPAGVGMSRDPQLFLRPGDVVEVEVESIGTLRNEVR